MLDAEKRLSTGFLVLLSLPTAAVGFALSCGIATTTWLLSTRYNLHPKNITLIWLMGPLMALLVQPLVHRVIEIGRVLSILKGMHKMTLTADERGDLKAVIRKRSSSPALARRARCVLL